MQYIIQKVTNSTISKIIHTAGKLFPIKEQIVNIAVFAGHLSVSTTQFWHGSVKVAMDDIQTVDHGYVLFTP